MKIFGYDGPFARVMGRIFDIVLLQFMWIVSSLPLITIGASTTALYTITIKMIRNEEPYILKGYFKAFKANFVQATKLWMISAGSIAWMLFIMRICMKSSLMPVKMVGIANAGMLLIVVLAVLYVFPIQARYENSVLNIIRNSVQCAIQYLPYSIGMLLIVFIPIVVTGFVPTLFPFMITFWIFAGGALIALGNSWLLNMVFEKVI